MSFAARTAGAILIAVGVVCREIYHEKSLWIWMYGAFVEGSKYGADGAPFDLYHREWALPNSISALGIAGIALIVLGLVLVLFPKRRLPR